RIAREDARLTARDLEALKDFIARLRERLKSGKQRQDDLKKETDSAADPRAVKGKQEELEKQLERLLAQAKRLLDKKGDRDDPETPNAPYRAKEKEEKGPPREEDSDEPLPNKKGKKEKKGRDKDRADRKDGKDEEDEDESKFMPRLGGPRQKLHERYAKKRRPV